MRDALRDAGEKCWHLASMPLARYDVMFMLHTALRLALALMLAICSPAWCACAFVRITPPAPSEAYGGGDAGVDSCCHADCDLEIADHAPPHSDEDCPGRENCDRACCEVTVMPAANRESNPATALDWHTAPVPSVICHVETDFAAGGQRRCRAGSSGPPLCRGENSLVLQHCLLLI